MDAVILGLPAIRSRTTERGRPVILPSFVETRPSRGSFRRKMQIAFLTYSGPPPASVSINAKPRFTRAALGDSACSPRHKTLPRSVQHSSSGAKK